MDRALGSGDEIIVVDGGSRDGTRESVPSHVTVIESAAGRGQQLNAGAHVARGEVLLFLHADTWLPPRASRAISEVLSGPDLVGGCFAFRLRGASADRPVARVLASAINARSRWLVTATGDQAIFARRSAFEAIGGFRDLPLFEDVLFYKELKRLGNVAVLDTPVLTSDRRWREHGYPRTIATHLGLRALLFAGVPPARLAKLYRGVR